MGTWSTSITGNDTAKDLLSEYSAVFFYFDIPNALRKIDEYIRDNICDETDSEEWCNYIYSLADFMWKKGILTEDIQRKAIEMIDNGFGLDLWIEAGVKTCNDRKKKLSEFKIQLLSPMPAKKKIKPNVHTERIFNDGDLIAVQLQTEGKSYTSKLEKKITDEEFLSFDRKYILMQIISCGASWSSTIVPEVKDYWANFVLFDGVYDSVPHGVNFLDLRPAQIFDGRTISPYFTCESSMFYFKKRNYVVIGSFQVQPIHNSRKGDAHIFWSINREWLNPDSEFLAAMGKDTVCDEYLGSIDDLRDIYIRANRYGRFVYGLSEEENDRRFQVEEGVIYNRISGVKTRGGKILSVTFGRIIGFISVNGKQIDNLYIEGRYQRNGFGTSLLRYAISFIGNNAYIDVPVENKVLFNICEKLGMKKTDEGNFAFVRFKKSEV